MLIIDRPSPNYFIYGLPIKAIVLHGTAGPLNASLEVLTNPRHDRPELAVSAHYVIDTNGDIYRLVSWWQGHRAWANGIVIHPDPKLIWLNDCIMQKVNPNLVTISIEHVATSDDMRSHRKMTDKQWASSFWLVKELLKGTKLRATDQTIVGHYQIDSVNKAYCPGVINIPAYINALNGIY